MSDESSEGKSACPHPEAVGTRWGDPISEERQAELRALADTQRKWAATPTPEHRESPFYRITWIVPNLPPRVTSPFVERGESPFNAWWNSTHVSLTGADVFWLAAYALAGPEGDVAAATDRLRTARADIHARRGLDLSALHLEDAMLEEAHLEGAVLCGAHLEEAWLHAGWDGDMRVSHLEGADLSDAHLERAVLSRVHLEGATLRQAHLEGASIGEAHLEGTVLQWAHLERAILVKAYLERADLSGAHLEGATLHLAHLEGADLQQAFLGGASLTETYFDTTTRLDDATLSTPQDGSIAVAGTHWGGVNLAAVRWDLVPQLGDEETASRETWLPAQVGRYRDALRANRQLARVLRGQELNHEADHFAYRAQVLQRHVLRRQGKWGAAFGSWLLDLVAGYGYKPMRSAIAYIIIICLFAGAYLLTAQFAAPHLRWDEALVLSISSFHGRGFFTPGTGLGDTVARLAAGEAIIGLLIEITFIATFTQRFVAR